MKGRTIERHSTRPYNRAYERRQAEHEITVTLQDSDQVYIDDIVARINNGAIRTQKDIDMVRTEIYLVGYDKICEYLIQEYGHR